VAECALLTSGGETLLYPFIRRPVHELGWLGLDGPCWDVSSAYGYGGLFGATGNPEMTAALRREFSGWCSSAGVVAELVRLHPILGRDDPVPEDLAVRTGNLQVAVDLRRSDGEIWLSYRHNNRKNIQKAIRSGVSIRHEQPPGEGFGDYLSIYAATMERRGAGAGFLFGSGFYETLFKGMPGMCRLFSAVIDGRTVSTELVLASGDIAYSFLGGTLEESFEHRPNNLLKHEIVRWGRDSGRSWFLLGGGPGGCDGIFEFKRSFAPDGVLPFRIAWKVHDRIRYQDLLARCGSHPPHSDAAAAGYPLRWRYGGT
jgi:hypothetical protein